MISGSVIRSIDESVTSYHISLMSQNFRPSLRPRQKWSRTGTHLMNKYFSLFLIDTVSNVYSCLTPQHILLGKLNILRHVYMFHYIPQLRQTFDHLRIISLSIIPVSSSERGTHYYNI